MMKYLQKLGKALMLPVAALPVCGILMGIGYALAPAVMGAEGATAHCDHNGAGDRRHPARRELQDPQRHPEGENFRRRPRAEKRRGARPRAHRPGFAGGCSRDRRGRGGDEGRGRGVASSCRKVLVGASIARPCPFAL